MRIGIDCRLYGPEHTGLGRYATNLVNNVLVLDKKNDYVLFVNSKHVHDFKPSDKIKIVIVDIPIYSFSEQIVLPFIFAREKLDLLHVPHFNVPIFYPGRFIITLHDLIKHTSKGKDTTTRSPFLYTVKRLGYSILFWLLGKRVSSIIAPTHFVKNDIVRTLKIPKEKIFVTYEASDGKIKKTTLSQKEKTKILGRYGLTQPFVIYTGNIYPHKNIDLLIDAILAHNNKSEVDLNLAIVCARSVFYDRVEQKINKLNAKSDIKLLGFVDDGELSKLYSLALCLVHPSKMEGFGLTGIEAMSAGLPVVSSNASCLPEIYGNAALYFDPNSQDELVKSLGKVISSQELREELIKKGLVQSKKYSWKLMTQETLEVYNSLGK